MTHNINVNKSLIFIIDLALFVCSFYIAFLIRYGYPFPEYNLSAFMAMLPWFLLVFVVLCFVYNIYSEYAKFDDTLVSLLCIVILTTLVSLALSYILYQFAVPRLLIALSAFLQMVLLGTWRYIVWRSALLILQPKRAIIIGYSSEIKKILQSINISLARSLRIEKEIRLNGKDNFAGRWEELIIGPRMKNVDLIIICSSVGQENRKLILNYCIQTSKMVMIVPDIYDVMLQRARLVSAGDIPIIQLQGLLAPTPMGYFKRGFDIIMSLLGMIILLPLGFLIMLIIKIDSRGPVIYSQERLGLAGKKFMVYKFRTMVTDAEKDTGPIMASAVDPRITRVGRLLRRTRLDEIPQLWNVFTGSMSLVGPRPERPYFVEKYCKDLPEFQHRHYVKGGITGLAQVEGRYSTDPDKKLVYDLLYAQNNNLLMDLVILLRTIKVSMQREKSS